MTIGELHERVKFAVSTFDAEKLVLDDDVVQYMHDANVQRLFDGKLTNGERITPDYADSTIDEKKRKGQPYDRVTLKDTGDMYSFLFVKVDNGSILFDSKVDYVDVLRKRYGEMIFGLTDENKKDLRGITRDKILVWFRNITDL